MITCGRCQASNPDGAAACQSCGSALAAPTPGSTPTAVGPTVPITNQPPNPAYATHGPPPGQPPASPPPQPGRNQALLVTAIVLGVVLLVAMTVLITLTLTRKSADVATTGTTTASSGPAASAKSPASKRSTTSTTPETTETATATVLKATLAPLPTVLAGDDAMLAFAFTGSPAAVTTTVPVVNDVAGDPKPGYVNPLPLRAQGPGTVQVAVRLVLADGTEVTTNQQMLTIELPPTPTPAPTPPPTVMPPYVPPPPSRGALGTVIYNDVVVRAGPTTASRAVGKVNKGVQVDVICIAAGETITNEGFTWARLGDGNYIFQKFLAIQADVQDC